MQTVVCIKWGNAFPPDYVNRLYRGVMRHTQRPTQFIVFTDDHEGLDPGVIVKPIPFIDLPKTGMRAGPWRKLALWSRDLDAEGDVLFLDLDVVITGNLDPFFDYEPGKMCLIQNWTQIEDGIGNSSVMRFRAGSAPHLVDDFEKDAVRLSFHYVNEQIYVTKESRLPMAFWPAEWAPSFKHTLMPKWPTNFWITPSLPDDARIVVFTGNPRPHEALDGKWKTKKWWKKLYKHVRPVPWVRSNWN